jgi:hypothetical protein
MTGPPPPIEKRKNFSLSPYPQNPKKGKNWLHWLHIEPSSVPAWNFYYGPMPLHNKMDTYCAINKAEWAIPWNSGVLQFKKGPRLPPLCLGGMDGYPWPSDTVKSLGFLKDWSISINPWLNFGGKFSGNWRWCDYIPWDSQFEVCADNSSSQPTLLCLYLNVYIINA